MEEGSPGSGTYTRHGYIFSSLAGCLTKTSENGAVNGAVSLLLCLSLSYAAFDFATGVALVNINSAGSHPTSLFSNFLLFFFPLHQIFLAFLYAGQPLPPLTGFFPSTPTTPTHAFDLHHIDIIHLAVTIPLSDCGQGWSLPPSVPRCMDNEQVTEPL